MNKEVIKAMNKRETKIDNLRKWWGKNGYKVMRVIFFFLLLGIKAKDKITSYLNSKEEWSEEKANEILSYYIPRVAEWNNKEKYFYFFDNGCGWSINYAKKYAAENNKKSIKLDCNMKRGKLRELYEKNGFVLVGQHDCGNNYIMALYSYDLL